MTIHVAFSGTQHGMTDSQQWVCDLIFAVLRSLDDEVWLHEGDCIGSDIQAATIARARGLLIHEHAPSDGRKRGWFQGPDATSEPAYYLERNRNMVDVSRLLLATPGEPLEVLRSGTWSTIRYARRQGKRVIVVGRDGNLLESV